MVSTKFERAAYSIVQHIQDKFATNVEKEPIWSSLSGDQKAKLALLFRGSLIQGYELGYQNLSNVANDELLNDIEHYKVLKSFATNFSKITSNVELESKKRPVAAFTIVKNERFFLPIWIKYYLNICGEENLYIIDNDSNDDTLFIVKKNWPKINILSLHTSHSADWQLITNVAKIFQHNLFHGYQAVIFSDADELLITQDGLSLKDYIEKFLLNNVSAIRAQGWGILHSENEPKLTNENISTRNFAFRSPKYDKTLLSKVPLDWSKGSHKLNVQVDVNDELILLHLRDSDIDIFFEHCQSQKNNAKHSSFQSASTREEVEQYMKTRKASWLDGESQYTTEKIKIENTWKKQLIAVGL